MKKLLACLFCLFPLLESTTRAQYTYTINNGAVTITGYIGSGGTVNIPNTINGFSVTGIGGEAFADCNRLTNVIIPDSVTSIGVWAFELCSGLTNATIGNSVTNIGSDAFENCTHLTSVKIGNKVITIGSEVFYNCVSLTSIAIPNSVKSIGDYAFQYCGLKNVVIGNGVTNIGGEAFSSCTHLTSITIPNSVDSIGVWAFDNCISLKNIVIGSSVTNIGGSAFIGCTNLVAVYFMGNAPSLGDPYVFSGDSNTIVYYSSGTTGWGYRFGGCPTALSSLSSITTITSAPPNTLSSSLKIIDTNSTFLSGSFRRWTGQSWQSIMNWNDINVHTNQPTVVIVHGWGAAIDGSIANPTQISKMAAAFFNKNPLANILGWDWSVQAVVTLPDGKKAASGTIGYLQDIRAEGLNGAAISAQAGSIQGIFLAHELQALHIDNSNLQLIGHSNGGAVVGKAASVLSQYGQLVKRVTILDAPCLKLSEVPESVWGVLGVYAFVDSPNLLNTTVNAMQYIHPESASQVEIYYSGTNIIGGFSGRSALGLGSSLNNLGANNVFNGDIYPGQSVNLPAPSTIDHLRILDWYTDDKSGTPTSGGQFFAGINLSILCSQGSNFKSGNYIEQGLNSHIFGTIVPPVWSNQSFWLAKIDGDNFEEGINWLGQHVQIFMYDVKKAAIRITSGSDGYFYRDESIPSNASYLTFDLMVENPDVGDFLTLTLGNEILYYKSLDTVDSNFLTVDPIFIGNFSGQTEALLFTLNHVGNSFPSILLGNIKFLSTQGQYTYITNINSTITITSYVGPNDVVDVPSIMNGRIVVSIETNAFYNCTNLTSITIPKSITNINAWAFGSCANLSRVYFQGNVPTISSNIFFGDNNVIVYYLSGTRGWGSSFNGCLALLWDPKIQNFDVRSNQFGFTIAGSSNLVVVVEACTNLVNPIWYPLQTATLISNSFYFSDLYRTNYLGRFYRLVLP